MAAEGPPCKECQKILGSRLQTGLILLDTSLCAGADGCVPTLAAQAEFGDAGVKQHKERQASERRSAAEAKVDANLIPLGQRAPAAAPEPEQIPLEDIPEVEWWDVRILTQPGSYEDAFNADGGPVREDRVTLYVEHPVPIEPPAEPSAPPPMPLMLTKKVHTSPTVWSSAQMPPVFHGHPFTLFGGTAPCLLALNAFSSTLSCCEDREGQSFITLGSLSFCSIQDVCSLTLPHDSWTCKHCSGVLGNVCAVHAAFCHKGMRSAIAD